MIIAHRINTFEDIERIASDQGIEFDVRDSNGKCIVQHDAFWEGLDLEVFLEKAGNRFFIVNIKSEGIEDYVINLMDKYNYDNFFLLDCSFPKIKKLSDSFERRIAVRFSEFESIETVLSLQNKVEWIWVDSFEKLSLTKEIQEKLLKTGMKLCFVSPELQKQPEKIQSYIESLLTNNIFIDAVCCKIEYIPLWDSYYSNIRKDNAFLVYHNGWTDIINTSALIHYYAKRHKHIYILIRSDSFHLHNYLTRSYKNITFIGIPINFLVDYFPYVFFSFLKNDVYYYKKENNLCMATLSDTDKECFKLHQIDIKPENYFIIGLSDKFRMDKYKNSFAQYNGIKPELFLFWKFFYEAYDIPYTVRVNYFDITRDIKAELDLYNKTVKKTPYIVTHLVEANNLKISKEDEDIILSKNPYELHQISENMLDAILILKNAKEMYLIDSVWAAICYHLDVKYRLFKDIPISVCRLRNYPSMFKEPVSLPNWTAKAYPPATSP